MSKRGSCLTANDATAWAMTQIGHYMCVKSLQAPNVCPQAVRNLKHTPPKSWGCEQTHRNALALRCRSIFACASSLEVLRNIPA